MKKKVVVMGGGTGTFTVLRGLKQYSDELELTAIMTMADDGGSNKVLRDEFSLLPTSGIRQAIVALSEDEGLMRELFTYRYYQGTGISGMTFGNLFMAALADILKSQAKSIEETCRLMKVKGRILPISYDDVRLLAEYEGGDEVLGEHLIDESNEKVGKKRIVRFRTIPKARIDEKARRAIEEAEMIILGPGDLYTNTIANLVVEGTKEALMKSKAKLVLVMNLMTKLGETYNYRASDFLVDLGKYLPLKRFDYVVMNNNFKFPKKILNLYKKEQAKPVEDDLGESYQGIKVVREDLLLDQEVRQQKGDKIKRSMVRHDPDKLARTLVSCIM